MSGQIGYQDWQLRASAPGNPASGYLRMWADDTAGKFKCLNSAGAQVLFDASITFGWMMGTGATGTNVGKRLVAPRAGQIIGGEIVIDASDGTTDLTFDIKKNGTSIFSSAQTITHGASAGAVTDLSSALSSSPTSIAKGDVLTLDITGGTSSWQFTVAMG